MVIHSQSSIANRESHIPSLPSLHLTQVVEVGLTVGAADRVEVETYVVEQFRVARAEQKPTELIARRATDALTPPDRAGGVLASVFLLENVREHRAQLGRVAQRLLDRDQLGVRQRIVQVVAQYFPRDRGHLALPQQPGQYTRSSTASRSI